MSRRLRLGMLLVVLLGAALSILALSRNGRPAAGAPVSRWTTASSFDANATISDVAFVDAQHGWAVGNSGLLERSVDGGQSWQHVGSDSADDLQRVRVFDATHALIAGGASLLRMVDGTSWTRLPYATLPVGLQDAASPDPATLLLAVDAGGNQGLYRSIDNGLSWDRTFVPAAGQSVDRVVFPTAGNGWACGSAGVYHSSDGGQTWQPAPVPLTACQALGFASSQFGFIGGTMQTGSRHWSAIALRSIDGGSNWTSFVIHSSSSEALAHLQALAFNAGGTAALAVVGTAIYATLDGGTTWTRQSVPHTAGATLSTVGFSGDTPFAVSGNSFLRYGASIAAATPTVTLPPSLSVSPSSTAMPADSITAAPTATGSSVSSSAAVATPVPSGTPAQPLPFPTLTPPLAGFVAATVLPLRLDRISPSTVTARSGTALSLRGRGFDSLATISLGGIDIVTAHTSGTTLLRFALPALLLPGVYSIVVTEPDGRIGRLPAALTVRPALSLLVTALRTQVRRGVIAVLLVRATPGAQLRVTLRAAAGVQRAIAVTVQRGVPGQWRVLLAIGPRVPLGPVRVECAAAWQGQIVRRETLLLVRSR